MKKQIIVIGLIIAFLLTSNFAQARKIRPKWFFPHQKQGLVQPKPEQKPTQEDVTPESEPVQEDEKPETDQSIAHIIVDPAVQSQNFYVNISVDHEDLIYEEGDMMTVTVESSTSGFLYLFYKDAAGDVTVLFPNKFNQANYIEGNKKLLIPDNNMNFKLKTSAPFGNEILQAIVTLKPINLQSVINFQDENKVFNQLSPQDLDAVEKKFNQDRDPENKIAQYSLRITTIPKAQIQQAQKKRLFVGICVSKYSNSRIEGFPVCEKNLLEMARFFNDNGAVDPHESLILFNEEVTKERIHELLTNYLPNHTNPGDEVFIYWAGISGRCKDASGDEEEGYDEALILYDSDLSDPDTMLIDDDFILWASNLKGRKVLFIFEGCNRFCINELASLKDLGLSNFSIIASGANPQTFQLVKEGQELSVMTWYMIDCLKKNSKISHIKLFQNVKPQVYEYSKKKFNFGQNLNFWDGFDAPMILNP